MKLIDLIELLFKPAPVQFEPCPWNGTLPARYLVHEWPDRVWCFNPENPRPVRGPRFMFQYSDRSVEWVGAVRRFPAVTFVPASFQGVEFAVGVDGTTRGYLL